MGTKSTISPGQHVFLQAGQQIDHIHIPQKTDRQIDYFLVNKKLRRTVKDCESNCEIDMGSDHRAL
eukprot:882970-Pyramimonas_sp.AAC.1